MRRSKILGIMFSAFFVIVVAAGGIGVQQWEKTHRKFTVEKYTKEDSNGIVHATNSDIKVDRTNESDTDYININTADIYELDKLPGIGEGLAKRIIAYREKNGDFEVIEDIMRVQGIGEKRFEDIKNLISVE